MCRAGLLAGLVLCLTPLPLPADALADIRSGLDRLGAPGPIKVRVEISRRAVEKEKPKGAERRGEAVVEYGPSGLSIHLDPDQLPKPGTKAERKKREGAAVRLSPEEALKLVDPAAGIRQLLDGATIVSDGREPFEGQTVRTVVLRPVPDLDEEDRKSIKRYEDVVTIRLDADGVAVALDRVAEGKISKLIISFTFSHRESRRYARVAGRLVTTTATEEDSSSGLGQSGGATTRWTVISQ
jgi:hypothetical protein